MALDGGLPPSLNVEFAAWMRLEPRARADDLARGIEVRTADPLWMLARQWQTGEFDGEDAGSPVTAALSHAAQPLDQLKLGAAVAGALPKMPLEAAVECESVTPDWRTRAQIGQQFERLARSALSTDAAALNALLAGFRQKYGLRPTADDWDDADRATRRYLEVLQERVIDGGQLLAPIKAGTLAPPAGVTAAQLALVVDPFRAWWSSLLLQPSSSPGAWRNQQLDYRFEVNPGTATDRMHLIAPAYRNGDLDWHSFSSTSSLIQGTWDTTSTALVPTRISVGGTSPRWWAFEDAATNFGALDVATPDLAKLLLMEFVLIYGDDWFSVPLPVTMPRLVRVTDLKVTNVFGDVLPIVSTRSVVRDGITRAGGNPDDPALRWELFTLSQYPANDPDAAGVEVLLIPPVSGWREESEPLEEIRFIRDEGANAVWGVEHLVAGSLGRAVHGFDAQRERQQRPREDAIAAALATIGDLEDQLLATPDGSPGRVELLAQLAQTRAALAGLRAGPPPFTEGAAAGYRLATSVPENWIPFLPASATPALGLASRSIRLRRSQMLQNTAGEPPVPIPAMSSLLSLENPKPLVWMEEASVQRTGTRVQLTAQRTRWVDGKTYVWLGRKVLVGKGEGSSGLRFDVLRP
jgi:hypothetical protein